MPSGHATVRGVRTLPRSTMNTCVAFVSATKPRTSSISASSAPGDVGLDLREDRLTAGCCGGSSGSRQSGGNRRTLLVISVRPSCRRRAACARRARSASGPTWLSRGSMPDVIFTPRVSVSRMCTPSRHAVRGERAADFLDDLLARRNLRERERHGRVRPAGRGAARAGRCGRRTAAALPTRRRRPARPSRTG